MRPLQAARRVVVAFAAMMLVASLVVAAPRSAAADTEATAKPGQRVPVPFGDSKVLSTCDEGPHAGPTYSNVEVHPEGAAALQGAAPNVKAFKRGANDGAVVVSPDARPGTVIIISWAAAADGCFSVNGGLTIHVTSKKNGGGIVAGGAAPIEGGARAKNDPCAQKNFFQMDAAARAALRDFIVDAEIAARTGYEYAEALDFVQQFINAVWPPESQKGREATALKESLDTARLAKDVLDTGSKAALELAVKDAQPVLTAEQALAANKAEFGQLQRRLDQKIKGTKKSKLRGPDRAAANNRKKELRTLIDEGTANLERLRTQYATQLNRLQTAKQGAQVVEESNKKFWQPLMDQLSTSTQSGLRMLGEVLKQFDAGQTIAQVPFAAGMAFWSAVAGVATAMSAPPPGCTSEPAIN